MKQLRFILLWALVAAGGCKKEAPPGSPTIRAFRSFAVNPFQVKRAPAGGYVMQCIEGSIAFNASPRAGFAQFIDADGTLGPRIDYGTLPTTIEGLQFHADDIWITDIVPAADGRNTIIGIGTVLAEPFITSLYLLIYPVDAHGVATSAPYHLLLSENASVVYDGSWERDPTPITRAYGVLQGNGDLVVAATLHQGPPIGATDFVVLRIPAGSSVAATSTSFSVPDQPSAGLWSLQPFGDQDHLLLVTDNGGTAPDLVLRELATGGSGITLVSECTIEAGDDRLSPYFVERSDGRITVGGSTLPLDDGVGGSFMTNASSLDATSFNAAFHSYLEAGSSGVPAQCAAGMWWGDGIAMMTTLYLPGTRTPYQSHDTKGEMRFRMVDPSSGAIVVDKSIIAGQGLRGLGLFNDNGRPICIGSRNAYNNVGVNHAFFMELTDPRLWDNEQ